MVTFNINLWSIKKVIFWFPKLSVVTMATSVREYSRFSEVIVPYVSLLPCLQTIGVLDRDSRKVIGRTRHVTSPIWSRIDLPVRKSLVLLSSK